MAIPKEHTGLVLSCLLGQHHYKKTGTDIWQHNPAYLLQVMDIFNDKTEVT